MGTYSSSDFDNLNDLKAILDDTASNFAQVLPDINDWRNAVL